MKKVFAAIALTAFVATSSFAFVGGGDKEKETKKACCASKEAKSCSGKEAKNCKGKSEAKADAKEVKSEVKAQ